MQDFLSFELGRDEHIHEKFCLTKTMVRTKGKGPKKAKNTKETVEEVSGSDTESNLRDRILDNTRHDNLEFSSWIRVLGLFW